LWDSVNDPQQPPIPPPPPHAGPMAPPPGAYAPYTAVASSAGVTVAAPPNSMLGLATAIAAGVVGAVVWYFIVTLTDRQFAYLAIGLGLLIGYGASWGAKGRGPAIAVIAAVVALFSVVASYYFITRHYFIEALEAEGFVADAPLIGSFSEMKEIVKLGYEAEASQYLYTIICVAAAAYFGFVGTDRSRFGRR